MRVPIRLKRAVSIISKYRIRQLIFVIGGWTLADKLLTVGQAMLPERALVDTRAEQLRLTSSLLLRSGIVALMSGVMGYLLIFRFPVMFNNRKRLVNLGYKTLILLACSFLLNFFSQFAFFYFIEGRGAMASLKRYWFLPAEKFWLIHGVPLWLLIFMLTQLLIEISQKYSPGVFTDILTGKYRNPCNEQRIIMFMDLKDSTPIAEKLGHQQYFAFIRDFISAISMAILEQKGRIYQYVGDEVVVSWPYSAINGKRCLAAIVEARKNLQKMGQDFRRSYGVVPEFRAGVHAGEVTVGEIGVIKKDLAMSGDTMNTTARIRSACSELQQKYLASKDFLDVVSLADFQTEFMGSVELKGKKGTVELYALKV